MSETAELSVDPRFRRLYRLRWTGVVLVVTSFLVYLYSQGRVTVRCHQDCYGASPQSSYGSLPYEPGHAWTHYANSWQWDVQHGLTQFALLASVVGLGMAAMTLRSPLWLYGAAAGALTAWLAWVLLAPAIP